MLELSFPWVPLLASVFHQGILGGPTRRSDEARLRRSTRQSGVAVTDC